MTTKKQRAHTTTVTTRKGGTAVTTSTAHAKRRKGTGTARQQRRAQLLERIRLSYWALSPQARSGFRRLCRLLPENLVITKTGTRFKVGPFVLFANLNQAAHYSGSAESVTVPPTTFGYAPPFPGGLQLASAYDAQGQWSLRLTGAVYSASVALALAPCATEGVNYQPSDYLHARPLPGGIPAGGVDVTTLFLSVYPAPPLAGEQVGAQIVGVTPDGFATAKLSLLAMTADASMQAAHEDADARRAA